MKLATIVTLAICLAQVVGAEWVWTRLDKVSPPSVYNHSLAYDSARGRVVMIGGNRSFHESIGHSVLNSVWEWDGTSWVNAPNSAMPAAYAQGAAAFDSIRKRTVFFGGSTSDGHSSNRTFQWNGSAWSELVGKTNPPARRRASMVFDEARGVCVLFGGVNGWQVLNDTWEFDGQEWRLVANNGPQGRFASAMVYDPITAKVVLHGGAVDAFGAPLSDTWLWDGESWAPMISQNFAPALQNHSGSYDPLRNEVVFSFGSDRFLYGEPIASVWALKSGNWRQLPLADVVPRHSHSTIYHPRLQTIILFGGIRNERRFRDLWSWDGSNWTSDDPSPPATIGGVLCFDEKRRYFVYFGGRLDPYSSASSIHEGQTWLFDGEWRRVFPKNRPPAHSWLVPVYDDSSERVLILESSRIFDNGSRGLQIWSWTGADWELLPFTGAQPRSSDLVWFDLIHGKVMMIAAKTGDPLSNSNWIWTGSSWVDTRIDAPLHCVSVAYDRTRKIALVRQQGTNRTWAWNGRDWSVRDTETGNFIYGPATMFDHNAALAIRYGGSLPFAGSSASASTWDGTRWTPLGVQSPGSRAGAAFASAHSGPALLFGGLAFGYPSSYYEYYDDTWTVQWKP